MKIFHKNRFSRFVWYFSLIFIVTLIFANNLTHSSSEFQFRTYRDGSEALVLGKIFADFKGIQTDRANLGFVEKEKITKSADVLAVYKRVNNPNAVTLENLNDSNWSNGIGLFAPVFLLPLADVAKLGYASNEFLLGQRVKFSNGEVRNIIKVEKNNGYLQVYYSGEMLKGGVVGYPKPIELMDSNYVFDPYKSQFGLQGCVLSWVYSHIPMLAKVERMQFLLAALCAFVLVLLSREYQLSLSHGFGIVFLISVIASPWIVSMARSLYWVPFLWFLPALVVMWLYRFYSQPNIRKLMYFLYFLVVLLKSLSGYEYLSTIVLFSLAIFLIDPFLVVRRHRVVDTINIVMVLFVLSLAAFSVALLAQSYIRADTVAQGLEVTLHGDAIKYTRLTEVFGGVSRGTDTPLLNVMQKYVFNWTTPVIFGYENNLFFPVLIILAVVSIAFQYFIADVARYRDSALVFIMLLAPISWLVVMKGHSVIHVHLNYVLWYFGFIPALIFVVLRGGVLCGYQLKQIIGRGFK